MVRLGLEPSRNSPDAVAACRRVPSLRSWCHARDVAGIFLRRRSSSLVSPGYADKGFAIMSNRSKAPRQT